MPYFSNSTKPSMHGFSFSFSTLSFFSVIQNLFLSIGERNLSEVSSGYCSLFPPSLTKRGPPSCLSPAISFFPRISIPSFDFASRASWRVSPRPALLRQRFRSLFVDCLVFFFGKILIIAVGPRTPLKMNSFFPPVL